MKRSGGIAVLIFVILGFFLSFSSLTAENISKDIAAFRTQLHLALDTIHKAQSGQTLDTKTLSISIINMEKIRDSLKKRVEAEQRRKIVVKPSKADEEALMMMENQVRKEMYEAEQKQSKQNLQATKEHLLKMRKLIKEMTKMHSQTIEQTGDSYR